jgi:hypothetical protein
VNHPYISIDDKKSLDGPVRSADNGLLSKYIAHVGSAPVLLTPDGMKPICLP